MTTQQLRKTVTYTLLAASIGLLAGCGAEQPANSSAQAAPKIKAITVSMSASAGYSGKLVAMDEVKVVSKVSGRVSEIVAKEGARVKKGNTLIQLETDDLTQQMRQAEAAYAGAQAKLADAQAGPRIQEIQGAESTVQQTQAALDSAQSTLELATKTYNRMRNNYDLGTITKDDLEKYKADYEKAQAGLQQAKGSLDAAKAKLNLTKEGVTVNAMAALQSEVDRTAASLELAKNALANATIQAPIDGIVVKKSIEAGEMAQPGVVLLNIVNLDQMEIDVSVPDTQINQIKAGDKAKVKSSLMPDKLLEGVVEFVSPSSDTNSNMFPVKLMVNNPDGLLRSGTVAEVYFSTSGTAGKLELPKAALTKTGSDSFVYKVDAESTVHKIQVQPNEKNADWVYVQENPQIHANDQIVLQPDEHLTDGMKVRKD